MFNPCNYCLVEELKFQANGKRQKLTIISDKNKEHTLAKDIYSAPITITRPQDFGKKYHVLWVMALPSICRC